jgi:hypothetical protein
VGWLLSWAKTRGQTAKHFYYLKKLRSISCNFANITFFTFYIHPLINFCICHQFRIGSKVIPFFLFFYLKKLKLKATLQSYIMTFCQVINKSNAIRAKWHNCNNGNSKWDYFVKITETKMMQLFQVIQRCFRKDASLRSRLCCFRQSYIFQVL